MPRYPSSAPEQGDFFRKIPKVDLHRHLEGSLRVDTMLEVIQEHNLNLPGLPELPSRVQIQPDDTLNSTIFLSKFQTLRLFYRSPEIIRRITCEAIADAAADNVRYLELRFSPVALSRAQGYPLADVMDWVCASAQQASQEYGVKTRLVASINRHEPVALGEQIAGLASSRVAQGIVGLDLTGDEAHFPAAPFLELFTQAHRGGLSVTIHAGEWGGPENVRQAIEVFKADRIGHGLRVLEDESVVGLAAASAIPFEICITSNYQSGVTPTLKDHGLPRMLAAGLNVTLNTDDPSISQITLGNEYRVACASLGVPFTTLWERILAAARAAFLPEIERQQLVAQLNEQFAAL
jgi:adenosine deaminase